MTVFPVRVVRQSPYAIAMLIAAAGAALLVVQWAGGRMFWVDEEMIAINLRDRSISGLAGQLSLGQAAPYLWLVLQRILLVLFGTGERVLRFLPMAFGVATLAVAVWIGRRSMTPVGAAALLFLCSIGQWLSFHALELKHYSADACFALLLPALTVWATDSTGSDRGVNRRTLTWWIAAALAQWVANGALFVTPACAVVLVLVAVRRAGWRGGVKAALPASIWLASFAVNYAIALGPARASPFLRSFWTGAFPPADAGIAGTSRWLADQVTALAVKPGGSGFGLVFWGVAAVGVASAPRYPAAFRLAFGLVPLSAFAWTAMRLVPMYERLSLWIVPALYVGIAMATEVMVALVRQARGRSSWIQPAAGAAAAALLLAMFVDIYVRGMTYVRLGRHVANHELDDRAAVRWLARRREPGDAWLTTHLGLPAIWWYAAPIDPVETFEVSWQSGDRDCGADDIATLKRDDRRRLLVYLGFDTDAGFRDALVARLGSLGMVVAYRPFADRGHALIVDLRQSSTVPPTLSSLSATPPDRTGPPLDGCLAVAPAQHW